MPPLGAAGDQWTPRGRKLPVNSWAACVRGASIDRSARPRAGPASAADRWFAPV